MSGKSNLDVAFDLIVNTGKEVSFKEIWEEVIRVQGYDEETAKRLMGQFYTNLSLDGRFVTLGDNKWDLRSRHTFDKVLIDMNDVYSDVETTSDEDVDEEDVEYNKMLEGDSEEKDDEESLGEDEEEKEENSEDNEF